MDIHFGYGVGRDAGWQLSKTRIYCECFMISVKLNKVRATVAFHLVFNLFQRTKILRTIRDGPRFWIR